MMKTIVIQAWTVHKLDGRYFLPYSHWIYLNEIVKYFDRICLLSPVKCWENSNEITMVPIAHLNNVNVYELPYAEGYIGSLKYFRHFFKAYRELKEYDVSYVRYPIPFGWLQKIFFSGKLRKIHFVGDPIDTIKHNPHLGRVKKLLYFIFFLPENWLYLWACKGAEIYTNGFHIAERLKKYGIHAEAVVSSTLTDRDFYFDRNRRMNPRGPKLIYAGYLRKSKGVETVIRSFSLLRAKYPLAELTIVGTGESEHELRNLASVLNVENVNFLGHIDNRNELNLVLRNHEIFCFASLSEGSPRVILEAMANGLNVVSTPVGVLPYIFEDRNDISFASYDAVSFCEVIDRLVENQDLAYRIREKSFLKAKNFTIEKFLKKVFDEG